MKLLSATIENYRVHRQTTVAFDPARTVIGGINESGKSTLVEAIHNALFLKSRATGNAQKTMLSDFHEGHPTVTLHFESGGRTYTIKKQFGGTAATSATTLADEGPAGGGTGGRTLRGEEAESRLHEILRAEEIGGGRGLETRIRMQWAHLWVWQGTASDDPVAQANDEQPAAQLRERLGRLEGGGVLESPLDAAAARQIDGLQNASFRDNGSIRTGSPLAKATDEDRQAEASLAAATAAVESLRAAVEAIDAADRTIAASDAKLTATATELKEVREKLRTVAELNLALVEQKAAAVAAEAAHDELVRADSEITTCTDTINGLTRSLEPATHTLASLAVAEEACEAALTAALDALDEAGHTQLETAAAVSLLEFCEQRARLDVERQGLGGRCSRIDALQAQAKALEDERQGLPVITPDDVAMLNRLERTRAAADATLEAIATRVELLQGGPARLGDDPLTSGTALTITAEGELRVGPPGAETIILISPGGGHSLAEATRARDRADRELAATLDGLRIESTAEARRVQARRQSLDADLHAQRVAIDGLGGDKARRDLDAIDRKIAEVEAEIHRRRPEGFDPGFAAANGKSADVVAGLAAANSAVEATAGVADAGEAAMVRATTLRAAVHRRLVAAQQARDAAAATAAQASAAVVAARKNHDATAVTRQQAAEMLRVSRGELESLEARRKLLVEKHGEERAVAIGVRAEATKVAATTLAATTQRIKELSPELLDRDQPRLERAITNLQSQRQEAETQRQVAREKIRCEGTADPRDDVARAVVRRRLAAATLAHARREAEAVRLLAGLFAAKKREVESQFVAPLSSRVADYLRTLYGPDTTVSIDYSGGRFQKLAVARHGLGNASWEFAQLSEGTREQVAAAFRLAMAEILAAGHDGTLPVIFDDAFTSADDERKRNLQRLLDLAADRGLQVIVCSCTPDDYAGLGASHVTLPAPSRSSTA